MKTLTILPIVFSILFTGCKYEVPLSEAHDIEIDSAILGLWEKAPDEKNPDAKSQRMLILKFSETEYLVQFPSDEDGIRYRAYPIEVGGITCVQLEVIGNGSGPLDKESTERFHVVSYETKGGALKLRTLNADLVDDTLKTTEEIKAAFLKHKDHPELFTNPLSFSKAGQ